jgi:hypothetical protein
MNTNRALGPNKKVTFCVSRCKAAKAGYYSPLQEESISVYLRVNNANMSTSSNFSSLVLASQLVTTYSGILILIAGVIGGFLNLVVFLSLQTFRQNSCAFYLTVMSFVNIGNLLTGLLSRIMIYGFDIDWTQIS